MRCFITIMEAEKLLARYGCFHVAISHPATLGITDAACFEDRYTVRRKAPCQ